MNKILILTVLVLLTGCKVDLEEEFGIAVEGSWEIHSITYGESDTTVFYTGARPRMEFRRCEEEEVMCPVYLFDLDGNMNFSTYRGALSDKIATSGSVRFDLWTVNQDFNDSVAVFRGFTFLLNSDTLFLAGGSLGFNRYVSQNASLVLVREQ